MTSDGPLLNDDALVAHEVTDLDAAGAPQWLRDVVEGRVPRSYAHRVAVFELPSGSRLWFVESNTYKSGFFVADSERPAFIFLPGTFRAAQPGESIFSRR
jgi:hypothetical protein